MSASLADLLPLWRTLREDDVTALVTPALDYVGGFELGGLDARFASESGLAGTGEALRSLLSGLDDGTTLHFLYRVSDDVSSDIDDYEASARDTTSAALRSYVQARAAWLRTQTIRKARLLLFFSPPSAQSALARGQLGIRLIASDISRLTEEAHQARLKALANLRNGLRTRLAQASITARELSVGEVRAVHSLLLNPSRKTAAAREPLVRDNLWDEATLKRGEGCLREYTEGEQLLAEDLVEERGNLRQERTFRRALSLKVLPESGTHYFNAEALLGLAAVGADGEATPFPYWLAVTVHLQPQGKSRFLLSTQHGLVDALKNAVPFLADRSVAKQASDDARQRGIHALFEELNAMSSKLCTLSVTLLLDAPSLDALDERTEVARAAFASAGNSELLLEEVSQLPAFLSVLPGAGPYQLRKKSCTSRNAADFLPVFAPWRGTARASSLLFSPSRDVLRLDLFDKRMAPAHHGLVVADTGSGKSVSLGALTLDALASGVDAILIDNGGSWAPLTQLLGGVHVPVDIQTAITPFRSWNEMQGTRTRTDSKRPAAHAAAERPSASNDTESPSPKPSNEPERPQPSNETGLDPEAVQDTVTYLELCVREEGQRGFDKLTVQLVSKAVQRAYETRFRQAPDERPLMSAFRDSLKALGESCPHPDDRRICEDLYRRLSLFVGDALYGTFLDRPSSLRFDLPLLTFDMAGVSKSPITRSIAMATVMQAVSFRASARKLHRQTDNTEHTVFAERADSPSTRKTEAGRQARSNQQHSTTTERRPTLVVVDEGHVYLGQDETAERFLERCYRVMRKFDVSMWMISQQFSDFVNAKSGEAIIGNSALKLFLRHASGHDVVADFFKFSARTEAAFRNLAMKRGHYSDFLLLYGDRTASVRLALHPLAYWILTTDPADKTLIERAAEKNPQLSRLQLLEELARHFPHGAGAGVSQ